MAGLVLHLGQQDRLALERRRPADPVALGQHAHHLGMRVLRNLPQQRLAIRRGHPVLRLDLVVGRDAGIEARLQRGLVLADGRLLLGGNAAGKVQALGVHGHLQPHSIDVRTAPCGPALGMDRL